MSGSAPDRLTPVRTLAEEFRAVLATAEALARANRLVDLSGLEEICGRLCAAALDLPPETGRSFRHTLADCLSRLEALAIALGFGR